MTEDSAGAEMIPEEMIESETEQKSITRRDFFSSASTGVALGAGLLLSANPQGAWAAPTAKSGGSAGHAAIPPGWSNAFHPAATAPLYPPRGAPKAGEKIHEFDIEVGISVHEIVPGIKIHAFTYNGTYPGPEIRVPEGDWVLVNFTNKTSEFHTIHWHGIVLANEMDGVPNGTQWGTGPGETFKYLFRAQPAGTHFYHCHNMTNLHVQAGMFGALIIEPRDPKEDLVRKVFPYEREYTMLLSEVDTVMVEGQMERMMKEMGVMQKMNESPKLMKEMNGGMMGWFANKKAFLDSVKSGYIPPYVAPRAGRYPAPNFNFFMINGRSYPMTDEMMIRSGENIRVRLIGAGAMPHYMHLHGHDFWHVCQDGSPLQAPIRLNTVPVFPGTTTDIIIQGTNPGMWHFHDHSDIASTNNGIFPGGMMTMLMYEDAAQHGVKVPEIVQVSS
ncbi:MAG: multicopper oxidase domain-containing protein [Methylotenera sp.]|nr:multicopper oxidase domain-containing protein [Oligoflexia bacterium]